MCFQINTVCKILQHRYKQYAYFDFMALGQNWNLYVVLNRICIQ